MSTENRSGFRKSCSTFQRTVNRKTKAIKHYHAAATKRHSQVKRLNGFISELINSGTITSQQVRDFMQRTHVQNPVTNGE
jgi:hypothetical protein